VAVKTEVMVLPGPTLPRSISLFHRIWPPVGLGVALIATVTWAAFLGYEFFRLAF